MTDVVLPKDMRILLALQSQLQRITIANGFNTDVKSENVFIGKSAIGKDTTPPALTILESPRPEGPDEAGENFADQLVPMKLTIQGWVADDAIDETSVNPFLPLYLFKADVLTCLGRTIKQVGPVPAHKDEYMFGKNADGNNLVTRLAASTGFVRSAPVLLNGSVVDVAPSLYVPITLYYTVDLRNVYL